MNPPTPETTDLARRLVGVEQAHAPGLGPAQGAVRACDRLRLSLARLAGEAGVRSLMARALALAAAEHPDLAAALVRPDGALEGVEAAGGEAGAAVLARLLGLLETFIGGALTHQLVHDAWPGEAAGGAGPTAGGRP